MDKNKNKNMNDIRTNHNFIQNKTNCSTLNNSLFNKNKNNKINEIYTTELNNSKKILIIIQLKKIINLKNNLKLTEEINIYIIQCIYSQWKFPQLMIKIKQVIKKRKKKKEKIIIK